MTTKRKLADFIPDDRNANAGTVRGLAMLEDSLRDYGAGRSILVDKNNKVIAGNKTLSSAVDLGLTDAIVVPTDGKQLVVVQRVDIDLDTKRGRELALADNRVGEVDLSWDAGALQSLIDDGADVARFFDADELDILLQTVGDGAWSAALGGLPSGDKSPFQQMTFTLSDAQAETVTAAMQKAKASGDFVATGNENSNGNALWRICDAYLNG